MAMFEARWLRDYGEYFYLGTMFPACIIVGLIIGWGIDYFLPTDPWGKIAGLILGIVAGFVNFIRDYQKIQRKKKNEPKKFEETGNRSSDTRSGGAGGSTEL